MEHKNINIQKYFGNSSWRKQENANTNESFSKLLFSLSSQIMANEFLDILPIEYSKAHDQGIIHIHNLESGGLIPYCTGHNLKMLLVNGMKTVEISSRPAKHLDSITDQLMNWLYTSQMEFAGAQSFSDVDTLLAPFIKKENLSYSRVKQQMQKLIYNLNFCYDDQTEVLTNNGFKLIKYIMPEDMILTLNMSSDELEWQYTDGLIYEFDYNGKMFHFTHKNMDIMVTPNHRMVILCRDKWCFIKAEDLKKKTYIMPVMGKWLSKDKEYFILPKINRNKYSHNQIEVDQILMDDFLRLLGIFLSEGCTIWREKKGHYYLDIAQRKSITRDKIKELLERLPFNYVEHFRGFHVYSKQLASYFRQFGHAHDKFIPGEFKNLSIRQLNILLEWLFMGDGYTGECGDAYFTVSEQLRDDVQECILKVGNGTNWSYMNNNKIFRIPKKKRNVVYCYIKKNLRLEDYKNKVYCLKVENGNFVTRRNGKVVISGNTMRAANQTPFSNLSLNYGIPKYLENEHGIVGGNETSFTYSECLEEVKMIDKAINEIMTEGDPSKKPFTFPILTINLTSKFDWSSPEALEMARNASTLGSYYWMNYIGSEIDEETIRSMCCRLRINLKEVSGPKGLWNLGEGVGSLGVVTINFPRLGYDMKGKDITKLLEELDNRMDMAINILIIRKNRIQKYMKEMMPFSILNNWSMKNYYLTIGVIGLNEFCVNYMGSDITQNIDLLQKILDHMREWSSKKQIEIKQLINIEQVPGEGSSYRLAYTDKKLRRETYSLGSNNAPYYSTLLIPPYMEIDPFDRIRLEEKILPLFSGGTVSRNFIGDKEPQIEAMLEFIKKISSSKIPYYDITSTFSICTKEGKSFRGIFYNCPDCNGRTEIYSRIVGYYRPVHRWNIGKKEEFKERKYIKKI